MQMPLLAILFSVIFLFPLASADITSGLVGYWKLDENSGTIVADSSGRGNTGTNVGGTWLDSYTNSGISFDGSSDKYVTTSDSNSLDINGTAITMSAWAKPTSTNYGQIITKLNIVSTNMPWDIQLYTNDYFYTAIKTDSNGFAEIRSANTASFGQWQHLVTVYNGTNIIFYVNGVQSSIGSQSGNIVTNDQNLYLGGIAGGEVFLGSIDEIRIYNRALSAGDVNQLYFCQPPSVSGIDWVIDGNTTCELGTNYDQNLVGQWKFDEGRGNVAKDFSGNGNAGTINGATHQTGKFGGDLNFDGVNDYVNVPYQSSLDITGNLTISAWVKSSSIATEQIIVSKISGDNPDYLLEFYRSRLNFQVGAYQGDGQESSTALSSNTWYHVVVVHNAGGTGTYYVNGVADGTTNETDPNSGSNPVQIGIYTVSSNLLLPFSGQLDDVRIYNRALTATDVNNLYKDTMVARVGNNFDLRNGSLTILSSSGVELQPTKKAILRIKATNRHQLIIQKLGRLIIRKN